MEWQKSQEEGWDLIDTEGDQGVLAQLRFFARGIRTVVLSVLSTEGSTRSVAVGPLNQPLLRHNYPQLPYEVAEDINLFVRD